ncbi:MAG: hypothetical protein JXI43_09765 [Tissierellales bacterium]|nr:hypothetical protein [Tissierellales bacterium]
MNLILHIGTAKTGTTSIQHTFGKSRKILEKNNLYYPHMEHDQYNHIHTFSPLFMDTPYNQPYLIARGFTKENYKRMQMDLEKWWIKEFESCPVQNFMISAENLSVYNKKQIERMKGFLLQYFSAIHVIVYIRPATSYINSWAKQDIKNGNKIGNLEDGYQQCIYSYDHLLGKIITYHEMFQDQKITLRPFVKEHMLNGDVIEDFLQVIDINISLEKVNSNQSIGKNGVFLLKALNDRYPNVIDGKLNMERGLVRRYVPVHVLSKVKDDKFDIDIHYNQEEAHSINSKLRIINHLLDSDYYFDEIIPDETETEFPHTEEISMDYYVDLINEYNKHLEKIIQRIEEQRKIRQHLNQERTKLKMTQEAEELLRTYQKQGYKLTTTIKNIFKYLYHKLVGLEGFDAAYYLNTYDYLKIKKRDPLMHYMLRGAYQGKNPNPDFDTQLFILQNPRMALSGENPLLVKRKDRVQ